ATAAPTPSYDARTAPAASGEQAGVSTAAAKPTRNITLRGNKRAGRFSISGKVGPRYVRRDVVIERKFGDGNWTRYNEVRTNGESRYRSRVAPRRDVGVVRYRAKTQKTGNYATSFSNRIYVITTTRG
ncbi:MAG: hypothetical protein H0V64_15725, partial [Geodermatophilaceae bacterium]|nr:hypothetical protein [Geodermatophilaceae bacterium]